MSTFVPTLPLMSQCSQRVLLCSLKPRGGLLLNADHLCRPSRLKNVYIKTFDEYNIYRREHQRLDWGLWNVIKKSLCLCHKGGEEKTAGIFFYKFG